VAEEVETEVNVEEVQVDVVTEEVANTLEDSPTEEASKKEEEAPKSPD